MFMFSMSAVVNGRMRRISMGRIVRLDYISLRFPNFIYLDSPAGVGLSYSENEADYIAGAVQTALDTHYGDTSCKDEGFILKNYTEAILARVCSHRLYSGGDMQFSASLLQSNTQQVPVHSLDYISGFDPSAHVKLKSIFYPTFPGEAEEHKHELIKGIYILGTN